LNIRFEFFAFYFFLNLHKGSCPVVYRRRNNRARMKFINMFILLAIIISDPLSILSESRNTSYYRIKTKMFCQLSSLFLHFKYCIRQSISLSISGFLSPSLSISCVLGGSWRAPRSIMTLCSQHCLPLNA